MLCSHTENHCDHLQLVLGDTNIFRGMSVNKRGFCFSV